MERIAVTGSGLVTPFGAGVGPLWDALLAGRSALARTTDPGLAWGPEPVGAIPPGVVRPLPADPVARRVAVRRALLVRVVGDALAARGLDRMPPGSWLIHAGQLPALHERVAADAATFVDDPPAAGLVGRPAQIVGSSHACASALFGVALARAAIHSGLTRFVVVAGVSILTRYMHTSMRTVRALSRDVARPFDSARAGISLGEGAGALVVEAADADAEILVAGSAARVTGTRPAASDVDEVFDCMRAALRDAGDPRPDYVHAHATATVQGDAAELRALSKLAEGFGLDGVVASSHKGAIGHLLQASGFVGLAAATQVLRHGLVPPTPGLRDPEAADRVVLPTRPLRPATPPHCVLINGFGFGGSNATVVLRAG